MSKLALGGLAWLVVCAAHATLPSDNRPDKRWLEIFNHAAALNETALRIIDGELQVGPALSLDLTEELTFSVSATIAIPITNNGTVHAPAILGEYLTLTGAVHGAGAFTGNVAFDDAYSPGNSPATTTLDNPTFGPFNVLTMELGGTIQGSEYDHLVFTGTATFGGTLDIVLINSFHPSPGDTFDLFDGNTTGSFAALNLPPLDLGLNWNTTQFATAGVLSVVPEPGAASLAMAGLLSVIGTRRYRTRS